MSNLTDISKAIDECTHRDLELKTDIDEILDILNEIKKRKNDPNTPYWLKEDTEELNTRYKDLLKKYSDLLKNNENALDKAEKVKLMLLSD